MEKTNLLKGDLGDLHMVRDIKKRPLREADAAEFVVRIDCKGPDGVTYDVIGYADEETDIDYEQGIYGYDAEIRDNVHPMTRADATKMAAEVIENAPAGDVLVGVVPYSTIPNDAFGEPTDDEFAEDSDEPAPDEFDDSEMDEGEESEEGSEEVEDEAMEESIARAKNQLRKVQERVLAKAIAKAKSRKLREEEDERLADYIDEEDIKSEFEGFAHDTIDDQFDTDFEDEIFDMMAGWFEEAMADVMNMPFSKVAEMIGESSDTPESPDDIDMGDLVYAIWDKAAPKDWEDQINDKFFSDSDEDED